MSHWWEAIEEEGHYDPDAYDDHDDELEDDPDTWDLMSGRPRDVDPRAPQTIREWLNFVIDGVWPDGAKATDEDRAYALDVVLPKIDERLWEAVLVNYNGVDRNKQPVTDHAERARAYEYVQKKRLDRTETWKNPLTKELAFATGRVGDTPYRDSRGRLLVHTPASNRKVAHATPAKALLLEECKKHSLDLDALAAPFGAGRPSKQEKARRAQLAVIVATVRARGVTLEAIGDAIGMRFQRVQELDAVGRKLRAALHKIA